MTCIPVKAAEEAPNEPADRHMGLFDHVAPWICNFPDELTGLDQYTRVGRTQSRPACRFTTEP